MPERDAANRQELEQALYEISRKFTLAEETLREIATYPQPSDGRKLRELARNTLEALR